MSQKVTELVRARWAAPDAALLAAIRAEAWTGHNIPLTETESTLGNASELIGDNRRTVAIKSLVRRWFARDVRVLDLGALEGGLSFEMAREGWDATGVEGRADNFRKASLIAQYYALPNLRFVQKDVKKLTREVDGMFDVILCCGLLYHLDEPVAHLRQLESLLAPDGMLFLDTHVAPDEHAQRYGTHAASLSPPVTFVDAGHEYDGRWWSEPAEGDLRERMWSAVSNARSMWLSRRSLIRALVHAGFHEVHELFGMYDIDTEFALRDQFSRLYLACRKEW
ncbi:MAG TPA: methyltransferase domain-containing protein [Thermoanaerobaculia bacterium]|nr:methyltransferase domain-containing protein [Thermoanaerobaculia bacterium]